MKLVDLNEAVEKFSLKKTGKHTDEGDPDHYEPDVTTVEYNIMSGGKKVGELSRDNYFGNVNGHLYNKILPNVSSYGGMGDHPLKNLDTFLNSKSGKRWMANIDKYKVLDRPTNDYRIKQ